MNVYITGFHGAGTRSAGKHFSEKYNLKYMQGIQIKQDIVKALTFKDVSLQCPQMAHHTKAMAENGTVYWMTRDHKDLIKTMVGMNTGSPAWEMMRGFKQIIPDDPVWDLLKYDGSEDAYYGFVGYYTLFVKVKEYFMLTHYRPYIQILKAEEMPYWTEPTKRTLTVKQEEFYQRSLDHWSEISESLSIS